MRRGISLLEVLFAMLLIVIGLLGAIALLPVAAQQAKRGRAADSQAVVGESAVSEFLVREMNRTTAWRSPVTDFFSATYYDQAGNPVLDSSMQPIKGRFIPFCGYCIDPLFVASQNNAIVTKTDNGNSRFFPYYTLSATTNTNADYAARMERITLGRTPSGTPMTARQALSIFANDDDLFLDKSNDSSIPASQMFSRIDNGSGTVVNQRRLSSNQFTWFATLSPKYSATPAAPADYTLNVVVMNNRPLTTLAVDTDIADPYIADERLVDVTQFSSGGVDGGEVSFKIRPGRGEADLALKVGEWVMLSSSYHLPVGQQRNYAAMLSDAIVYPPNNAPQGLINVRWDRYADPIYSVRTDKVPIYAWYRVVDVDADIIGQSRAVTLQGGNWTMAAGVNGVSITQATIMTGVVGVYERSVELRFK